MKRIILILHLLIIAFASPTSFASRSPSSKLCAIMKDAISGHYTPEELCRKYNGTFCSDMKIIGQGICAANGGFFCEDYKTEGEAICEGVGGPFCSDVKSFAGGICSILDGTFCEDENDYDEWLAKLSAACYW